MATLEPGIGKVEKHAIDRSWLEQLQQVIVGVAEYRLNGHPLLIGLLVHFQYQLSSNFEADVVSLWIMPSALEQKLRVGTTDLNFGVAIWS